MLANYCYQPAAAITQLGEMIYKQKSELRLCILVPGYFSEQGVAILTASI